MQKKKYDNEMYVQLLYLKQRTSITIYCQNMHLAGFRATSSARGPHARETSLVYIKNTEIVWHSSPMAQKNVEKVKLTFLNAKIQHWIASGTLQFNVIKQNLK